MKRTALSMIALAAAAGTLIVTSCDWSSGSQANFNNSNLSNISNISGFYRGQLGGGRAVGNTSNGNITSLTIQQSGNRVEVVDNQGSRYRGSVGAPLAVASLAQSEIPAGALLSTFQISWTGKDGVSARDVEFTGTISFVTITSVQGSSSSRDITRDSDTTISGEVTNASGSVTTTDITTSDSRESSTNTEFQLTEDATQLRLQGTWIEVGGKVSTVDAIAVGINAVIFGGGGGGTP